MRDEGGSGTRSSNWCDGNDLHSDSCFRIDLCFDPSVSPDHGGLTTVEVRAALQANHRVTLALFKHGHLATFRAPNPVNRRTQTLVAKTELEKFRKTYVSLHMLAKERKQHHVVLKMEIDVPGIKPAFDHRKVYARFYRRRDC
jgi:hypothetical protein